MLKGANIYFYCLFDESHFPSNCSLSYVIMECIELKWLCKHMKKVRNNHAPILVLNWVKHIFALWVSLKKDLHCLLLILQRLQSVKQKKKNVIFGKFIQKVQWQSPLYNHPPDNSDPSNSWQDNYPPDFYPPDNCPWTTPLWTTITRIVAR